jgi:hypothetical protein
MQAGILVVDAEQQRHLVFHAVGGSAMRAYSPTSGTSSSRASV